MGSSASKRRLGFTLIELLVVISIIALLISILLPSLQRARDQAKAVKCAANQRAVGLGTSVYLAEFGGTYPPSYVYPTDIHGSWSLKDDGQSASKEFGYLHWSYFLFEDGKVKDDAFQCPNYPMGGAPRTNPGPDHENWELGEQRDDDGQTIPTPTSIEDKQATRMSYAANAAIMPRNKFTGVFSGGYRVNRLVKDSAISRPGDVTLATEYLLNWKAIGIPEGNEVLVKSHRPINVFFSESGRFNEYMADASLPRSDFVYGLLNDQETFGVYPLKDVSHKTNILDHSSGIPQINAVGRHHPGGDRRYGGTANFLFCDGHVERMTPLESMRQRKWGEQYYSLTGPNKIMRIEEH